MCSICPAIFPAMPTLFFYNLHANTSHLSSQALLPLLLGHFRFSTKEIPINNTHLINPTHKPNPQQQKQNHNPHPDPVTSHNPNPKIQPDPTYQPSPLPPPFETATHDVINSIIVTIIIIIIIITIIIIIIINNIIIIIITIIY